MATRDLLIRNLFVFFTLDLNVLVKTCSAVHVHTIFITCNKNKVHMKFGS